MLSRYIIFSTIFIITSCSSDVPPPQYDETALILNHENLPTPELPDDNPLTVEGVKLGRMLFYETLLSKDNTQSCASCHLQKDGFSDINKFSIGVEGKTGTRQAMPVFNMAWHVNGFFWDGRAHSLRDQALRPIQDPLEMNESLANVISKLSSTQKYKDQFIRAFKNGRIDDTNLALALEQFMFSIISNDSKYDRFKAGKVQLSESEERGRQLFFAEFDPSGIKKGAECFHCHAGPNFTNDEYMNNGLDDDANFTDLGRAIVTQNNTDNARFLTPSLRNIAVTAPYMHDGRFNTLEEVIEHYDLHVKQSSTVEFILQYNLQPGGLGLSKQDKSDLVDFLKTLTDQTFLTNKAYSRPN